jgi:hypothetical protein
MRPAYVLSEHRCALLGSRLILPAMPRKPQSPPRWSIYRPAGRQTWIGEVDYSLRPPGRDYAAPLQLNGNG